MEFRYTHILFIILVIILLVSHYNNIVLQNDLIKFLKDILAHVRTANFLPQPMKPKSFAYYYLFLISLIYLLFTYFQPDTHTSKNYFTLNNLLIVQNMYSYLKPIEHLVKLVKWFKHLLWIHRNQILFVTVVAELFILGLLRWRFSVYIDPFEATVHRSFDGENYIFPVFFDLFKHF